MTDTVETGNTLTGRVKWFNNKAGYGFITVTSDCDKKENDVFVHHSAIMTSSEQYKYLVQGEYVSFKLNKCNEDQGHEYQADSVSGVFGDKLMCETRNENRTTKYVKKDSSGDSGRSRRRDTQKYTRVAVQVRGDGPRENEEWMLVRRKKDTTKEQSNSHSL
jgi:CspA family cold shock protein|tara:strand:- start:67 stop:552 length:486 start_codon:yes stop_codon:yes gene_type:complete